MSFLTASVFLKALGWALLNSMWQFAICWLLYRVLMERSSKLSAAVKHTAALCLLFTGTIFFILECSWKYYTSAPIQASPTSLFVVENTHWYNNWQLAGTYLDIFIPYFSAIYLAWVIVLSIKMGLFVRHAGNLQMNGVTKMDACWRMYIKNISAQLGIRKNVNAYLSVHVDTPQVIGFLKPVILVPAACLTNLTPEQLEAVLLHELVHIRRNDYLLNMFIASIEICFFFNPFVKQLTTAIRKEREYSCDDMVLQFQYQPGNYAAALLTLEKSRLVPVTYGIAASGKNQKQLLTRIERIVGVQHKPERLYKAGGSLLILLLLGFIATIHPSPEGTDMFDSGPISFAGNAILGTPSATENKYQTILSNNIAATGTNSARYLDEIPAHVSLKKSEEKDRRETAGVTRVLAVSAKDDDEENADNNVIEVIAAADKQTIDFSLPQNAPVDAPVTPDPVVAAEEPYVPASSFSFRTTQDTSRPKIKGETYSERQAREAMLKAQKALAMIDWKKIEQGLKSQPKELAKLKKQLTIQLQNLNWQKINAETKEELQRQQAEKLQEAFRQDEIIKQFQQKEVYLESLQQQLTEQEQVIKVSGQRIEENQKAVEERQKKLQQEMKKKKIIYI